jgi:hypothetical protein
MPKAGSRKADNGDNDEEYDNDDEERRIAASKLLGKQRLKEHRKKLRLERKALRVAAAETITVAAGTGNQVGGPSVGAVGSGLKIKIKINRTDKSEDKSKVEVQSVVGASAGSKRARTETEAVSELKRHKALSGLPTNTKLKLIRLHNLPPDPSKPSAREENRGAAGNSSSNSNSNSIAGPGFLGRVHASARLLDVGQRARLLQLDLSEDSSLSMGHQGSSVNEDAGVVEILDEGRIVEGSGGAVDGPMVTDEDVEDTIILVWELEQSKQRSVFSSLALTATEDIVKHDYLRFIGYYCSCYCY